MKGQHHYQKLTHMTTQSWMGTLVVFSKDKKAPGTYHHFLWLVASLEKDLSSEAFSPKLQQGRVWF
jgi:hypothetical protein